MSSDGETSSIFSSTPVMTAEAGYDGDELQAPIRISGFLSMGLGAASAISYIGYPLLLMPLAAILLGIFALRKYSGRKPVGVKAAYFGIIMAIGFGSFGLGVPLMKRHTLATQGEHYARQFIKLVANGEDYYALELRKEFPNRFISTMDLDQFYAREATKVPNEDQESQESPLESLRSSSAYSTVRDVGPDGIWELDRAISVTYRYGRERVDIVFANHDRPKPRLLRLVMECQVRESTGDLEWHVANFMMYRERIVAESIL